MKTLITTLAVALLLAACSTLQPQATTPAPGPTADQLTKVFEAGVYYGAISLQEVGKSGKYKDVPIPMDVIQSTAKEKLKEAQQAAAAAKAQQPTAKPAAKGGGK